MSSMVLVGISLVGPSVTLHITASLCIPSAFVDLSMTLLDSLVHSQ